MRQLLVPLTLLALVAVPAQPALADFVDYKFDVAQGFNFNPASHASVAYLTTLGGIPGDMPVTLPDGTTKKVTMVLAGLNRGRNSMGMGGRVSAATKERLKYANQPNKFSHMSFTLECWAYDPNEKRYYKSLSSAGRVLSGTMPKERASGGVMSPTSNNTQIDLTPARDITSPVNHSFSFWVQNLGEFQTIEVASSATYKEIHNWGGL